MFMDNLGVNVDETEKCSWLLHVYTGTGQDSEAFFQYSDYGVPVFSIPRSGFRITSLTLLYRLQR